MCLSSFDVIYFEKLCPTLLYDPPAFNTHSDTTFRGSMKTNAISAKQRLMKLLCFNYQLRHAASHKIVEARRIVTHSWNPPERLHFDERMDCRISTHLLTLLILLQWLPQVEGSHFRHASIMWAPTDSNSNTVRTNHLACSVSL